MNNKIKQFGRLLLVYVALIEIIFLLYGMVFTSGFMRMGDISMVLWIVLLLNVPMIMIITMVGAISFIQSGWQKATEVTETLHQLFKCLRINNVALVLTIAMTLGVLGAMGVHNATSSSTYGLIVFFIPLILIYFRGVKMLWRSKATDGLNVEPNE